MFMLLLSFVPTIPMYALKTEKTEQSDRTIDL